MTALDELCAEVGITWRYFDGLGRESVAPEESRRAVLAAMGYPAETEAQARDTLRWIWTEGAAVEVQVVESGESWRGAEDLGEWRLHLEDGGVREGRGGSSLPPLPPGRHRLLGAGRTLWILASPPRLPVPSRGWGATLPLYGLWEEAPEGLGSYRDLARAAEGLLRQGASFVGINPVHAGFPLQPYDFSPYAPSSRRHLNVLHVDVSPASGSPPGERRWEDPSPWMLDPLREIPLQRAALERAYSAFSAAADGSRSAEVLEFEAFCRSEGPSLEGFALHQALSERWGPFWTDWPEGYRSLDSPAVRAFAALNPDRMRFHAWAQWQAHRQLSEAAQTARSGGRGLGLYLDLAVGTHPGGAETWAEPFAFATGVSLGAPADAFAPEGQAWNVAPFHPRRLLETGFQPLVETLRQQLRYAGLLRIDHIAGFQRGFWVPQGGPGVYVRMPRDPLLALLRIEATRARAILIGEDLGTVPPDLRRALDESGILGCRLAMFERDWEGDGRFRNPEEFDECALSSFGSHDLPPWLGWRRGIDLERRAEIARASGRAQEEDDRALTDAKVLRRREVEGLDRVLGPAGEPDDVLRLHRFLARTSSVLTAVQIEDVFGATEQANLPGTVHAHPNWRRRVPVPASRVGSDPRLLETAAVMAEAGRSHVVHTEPLGESPSEGGPQESPDQPCTDAPEGSPGR